MNQPKYSILEIERRWFVNWNVVSQLVDQEFTLIEDQFLCGGSIRLRKMTQPNGKSVFKLGKKYQGQKYVQPITNIYLDEQEYEALKQLGGEVLVKRRYKVDSGSIDVPSESSGLQPRFEIEFSSLEECLAYLPPDYVLGEVISGFEKPL